MNDVAVQSAQRLITDFATRTGIGGGGDAARRYLWTDAFAVFALVGLYQRSGIKEYLDSAVRLVDLVHHILGCHRPDDARAGWISGLSEADGERRPTSGGLRIGKALPERAPGQALDEQLEWERDGQYFHYLTKWMLALNRVCTATEDLRLNPQAVELATAAHRAFVYESRPGGAKRMYWKMSIDLTRPLVLSMGHLDPLDGFVTFSLLQATQRELGLHLSELDKAVTEMREMCEGVATWATTDPLSLGGLLAETAHLIQLIASGDAAFDALPDRLLRDAQQSLAILLRSGELNRPPESRLAFRELGLSIGLRSLDPMRIALKRCPERFGGAGNAAAMLARIESMAGFHSIIEHIEHFWLAMSARNSPVWTAHLDINAVMLATSLVPEGHLLCNCWSRASKHVTSPAWTC